MTDTRPVAAHVAIVYRIVPDYRVDFYNRLEAFLASHGVALTVYGGQALSAESFRESGDRVACHRFVRNRYLRGSVYYQPVLSLLRAHDLVIVEQANSALVNYPLLLRRAITRRPLIAFWGHGDDLQQQAPARLRRALKRMMTRQADHFFAYTRSSARIVRDFGFPDSAITVVANAIDVSSTLSLAERQTDATRCSVRQRFGLKDGPMLVACSRLTEGKAIPFMVDACRRAQERDPRLQLVVIGDGPLGPWLEEQGRIHSWIKPLGARYDAEKAEILTAGDLFLLPSAAGLSILDAFAAGLPVLVADFQNHGPEVDYLEHEINGLLTAASPAAYAEAIISVLSDPPTLDRMAEQSLMTASTITVDNMARNFGNGILRTLDRAGWMGACAYRPGGASEPA
jgi:glycosyltransferase involved in cell wall biosynthesis